MANMSYCRFENTFRDLNDCYNNMDNDLSELEQRYKKQLINLCQKIAEDFEE